MRAPIVDVRGVSKAFQIPRVRRDTVREHVFGVFERRGFDRLVALDEVSFGLEPGETLGIMGRNGSGKSTLLRIVSGIYPPDRGSVVLNAAITPILELGVGWNPELDALDNVYLLASVMGLPLRAIRARLDSILAFAELERFAELKLKFYSSGMAARLAYAVAFSAVREVLILDEIFSVGDAGFKAKCEDQCRALRAEGRSVILVSHDPRVVRAFCDRVLLLEGGRIVMNGEAGAVVDRYLDITRSVPGPHVSPLPEQVERATA